MPKPTRHQKRADGKTQTSISLREDILERAKKQADAEGRSLSNWLEQMLKEKFPDVAADSRPDKKDG